MNRKALLTAVCIASCLTAVPPARAIPLKCDRSPYDVDLVVVHGNGIRTPLGDAKASLEKLRPLVDEKLGHQPYAISYGLAYNHQKGWLSTAYKVIKERVAMSGSRALRMLSGIEPMPDSLRDELVKLAAEYDLAGFGDDADLQRHVLTYREHLRSGRKVLVIAHSEGNMYANAAYRQLFETELKTPGERSFGIVGIASPAPSLAGWHPLECEDPEHKKLGCYTTLQEDLVIGGVILLQPDTARANIFTKTPAPKDIFRHRLDQTYLKNDAAREQILRHVAAFVSAFEPLEAMVNQSQISAYLEWDTNADLDLHVWERDNKAHVYATFPESDFGGHLDADDLDGYGPEHYYAECSTLKEGVAFRFAVGYFAGLGPVPARLRLKIGTAARTYATVLAAPTQEESITKHQTVVTLTAKKQPKSSSGADTEHAYDSKYQLIDDYELEVERAPGVE
jgi:hypothetical protein